MKRNAHLGTTVTITLLTLLAAVRLAVAQEVEPRTTAPQTEEESSSEPVSPNGVLREFTGIVAGHALRSEPHLWTDAGTMDVGGFASMVLSLHGELQGSPSRSGEVSVVLVPDRPELLEALNHGEIHLALEARAAIGPVSRYYFSQSFPELSIGFPRYRVFVYNTTPRNTTVNVFAYLTR